MSDRVYECSSKYGFFLEITILMEIWLKTYANAIKNRK